MLESEIVYINSSPYIYMHKKEQATTSQCTASEEDYNHIYVMRTWSIDLKVSKQEDFLELKEAHWYDSCYFSKVNWGKCELAGGLCTSGGGWNYKIG